MEAKTYILVIIAIIEVLAGVVSVIGNAVVIYVMTRDKMLKRLSNYYVISIAVADFLAGIILIPVTLIVVSEKTSPL